MAYYIDQAVLKFYSLRTTENRGTRPNRIFYILGLLLKLLLMSFIKRIKVWYETVGGKKG